MAIRRQVWSSWRVVREWWWVLRKRCLRRASGVVPNDSGSIRRHFGRSQGIRRRFGVSGSTCLPPGSWAPGCGLSSALIVDDLATRWTRLTLVQRERLDGLDQQEGEILGKGPGRRFEGPGVHQLDLVDRRLGEGMLLRETRALSGLEIRRRHLLARPTAHRGFEQPIDLRLDPGELAREVLPHPRDAGLQIRHPRQDLSAEPREGIAQLRGSLVEIRVLYDRDGGRLGQDGDRGLRGRGLYPDLICVPIDAKDEFDPLVELTRDVGRSAGQGAGPLRGPHEAQQHSVRAATGGEGGAFERGSCAGSCGVPETVAGWRARVKAQEGASGESRGMARRLGTVQACVSELLSPAGPVGHSLAAPLGRILGVGRCSLRLETARSRCLPIGQGTSDPHR